MLLEDDDDDDANCQVKSRRRRVFKKNQSGGGEEQKEERESNILTHKIVEKVPATSWSQNGATQSRQNTSSPKQRHSNVFKKSQKCIGKTEMGKPGRKPCRKAASRRSNLTEIVPTSTAGTFRARVARPPWMASRAGGKRHERCRCVSSGSLASSASTWLCRWERGPARYKYLFYIFTHRLLMLLALPSGSPNIPTRSCTYLLQALHTGTSALPHVIYVAREM